MRKLLPWLAAVMLVLLTLPSSLEAHSLFQATATNTPRPTPTLIGTVTNTPMPTNTPTDTPTDTPTVTITATPGSGGETPSPTAPTPTRTPTPTKTPGSLPWTGVRLNGDMSWLTAGILALVLTTLVVTVRVMRHRYTSAVKKEETRQEQS